MVEEEAVEEEVEPAVSTRLEHIEKLDRSVALLDEYESEELGSLGTSLCAG
jgi:GTP-binding protein Era